MIMAVPTWDGLLSPPRHAVPNDETGALGVCRHG